MSLALHAFWTFLVWIYFPLLFQNVSGESVSTKKESKRNIKDTIPTYEEYIELSKKRNWFPADPIDKLKNTCRKYSQIFDARDVAKTNEIAKMIDAETDFLLSVLKKSTHKQIDLSEVFFEALEGVHRSLFHVQKQILQTDSSRAEAEFYSKSIIYGLLTALLRSTIEIAEASPLNPHLTIDLNKRIGRDGNSALATAVGLRLFRLYGPLVSAGATMEGAIAQAVINQDVFSLELLLNISKSSGKDMDTGAVDSSQVDLACSLGYVAIADMLHLELHKASRDTAAPYMCPPLQSHPSSHTDSPTIVTSEQPYSGYSSDLRFQAPHPAIEQWEGVSRRCNIDVIDSPQAITPEEFVQKYVLRRRPVALKGYIDSDTQYTVWSYDNLVRAGENVWVTPQSIPYGNQMGSRDHVSRTTLATYLSEMRASSKLLQDRVEQTLDSGMITDDLRLDNVGGLSIIGGDGQTVSWNMSAPLYVFDNEIIWSQSSIEDVFVDPFRSPSTPSKRSSRKRRGAARPGAALEKLVKATHEIIHPQQEGNQTALKALTAVTRQFFAGPALSGAPFHSHSHAFNALMHGRKLWLLLPPGYDIYSNIPPVQWSGYMASASAEERKKFYPYYRHSSYLAGERDEVLPCHVEQQAGEVLFVPSMWTHQILNLAETVGFATEIHY